jgi:uncharacterized protein (DUF885 family)
MKTLRIGLAMVLLAGGALPAHAQETSAETAFKDISTAEWAWRRTQLDREDENANGPVQDHLPHVDAASQQARLDYWTAVLKRLDGIDVKALTPENQINYAVYRTQIENLAADERLKTWQAPLNSDSAFWSDLTFRAERPFRTEDDYRRYIRMLGDIPRYFHEQIDNMRLGMARGFTVPRVTLAGRDKSIAEGAADVDQNPFFKPFQAMAASIPADVQARLKADAAEAIRNSVIPAHRELLAFMDDEYIPHARTTLAAEALPDGAAYYRQQIHAYTTLDMSPDEIHALGLREVARIHAEMIEAMRKTGFQGDLPAFLTYLRTDPKFYAKTPDELLMRAAWIAKKADGKVGRYIGKLPRGRFAIEPVPANIAPYWTAGRGSAAIYWVNTYDLPSRPLYNLTALTLHESSPGHSLQLSLAQEFKNQPAYRRDSYISAYGEGWALYVEKLGVEMGLYETPYDDFGRLSYEMWRACRLVVDTGIHHMGWTREQAIDYLAQNTALPRHEIETEVDRYISWPAQALSYKLGELDIERLRAKAEQALGGKFDIRAFHDAVLSTGSVPLPVLDAHIDQWIAERGPATPAD